MRQPLPRSGRLVSHTTVWVARPGLPSPYTIGQVDLGDGAIVFTHIRNLTPNLNAPLDVTLEIAPTDEAVPLFWFNVRSPDFSARDA
jgi:hypothetical protein